MIYPNGMRKLFKSCGSWNSGSFQITSFQVRTMCQLWMVRKHARPDASPIETQNLNEKSMFECSLLSSFYERSWVTQTPNHHNSRNRRIVKKEEQGRLLLKLYEKRIQYFVWKNNSCQGRLTCCAEVFSSRHSSKKLNSLFVFQLNKRTMARSRSNKRNLSCCSVLPVCV